MCGIVAVLAQRSSRTPADPERVLQAIEAVTADLSGPTEELIRRGPERLAAAAAELRHIDGDLRGAPGLRTMLADPATLGRLDEAGRRGWEVLRGIEAALD